MKTNARFFYLRSESGHPLPTFAAAAREVGVVLDTGTSTAKDPSSVWVEIKAAASIRTIEQVRAALGCFSPRVVEVVEIEKNEGKLQAKQLDLLQGLA